MGLLDWFKSKDARANHDFNDKDRELSKEIRRQRAEINALKMQHELERERVHHELEMTRLQQQLEDMQPEEEIPEEGGGNTTDMMMMAILSKMMNNTPGVSTQPTSSLRDSPVAPLTPGVSLSDEQINEYWENMPKFQKILAKKATDEQIGNIIRNKIPGIDQDSIDRCIRTVKGI